MDGVLALSVWTEHNLHVFVWFSSGCCSFLLLLQKHTSCVSVCLCDLPVCTFNPLCAELWVQYMSSSTY